MKESRKEWKTSSSQDDHREEVGTARGGIGLGKKLDKSLGGSIQCIQTEHTGKQQRSSGTAPLPLGAAATPGLPIPTQRGSQLRGIHPDQDCPEPSPASGAAHEHLNLSLDQGKTFGTAWSESHSSLPPRKTDGIGKMNNILTLRAALPGE